MQCGNSQAAWNSSFQAAASTLRGHWAMLRFGSRKFHFCMPCTGAVAKWIDCPILFEVLNTLLTVCCLITHQSKQTGYFWLHSMEQCELLIMQQNIAGSHKKIQKYTKDCLKLNAAVNSFTVKKVPTWTYFVKALKKREQMNTEYWRKIMQYNK